jgi:hypothetical protein
LTFLVKLSTALPFVCPAGGSFAIAAATAAVAASVASFKLADGPACVVGTFPEFRFSGALAAAMFGIAGWMTLFILGAFGFGTAAAAAI